MNETLEEIKQNVLAHCLELCPNVGDSNTPMGDFDDDDAHRMVSIKREQNFFPDGCPIFKASLVGGGTFILSERTLSIDKSHVLEFWHRLLGLETSRAVEAERAKAQEIAQRSQNVIDWERYHRLRGDSYEKVRIAVKHLKKALAAWKGGNND